MLAALSLAKLLSFTKTNWRIFAILGTALALVGIVTAFGAHQFHRGAESVREADRKAYAKAVAKAAPITAKLAQSAAQVGTESDAGRERIIYRTKTITERIPYEIPRSSDVRLSARWLSEYNASLGLPEGGGSTGQPADGSGGLYSADALVQAIVPNNGVCAWYAENYPRLLRLYDEAHDAVNGFRP